MGDNPSFYILNHSILKPHSTFKLPHSSD